MPKVVITLSFLFPSIEFNFNRDKKTGIFDHDVNPSLMVDHIFFDNICVSEQSVA